MFWPRIEMRAKVKRKYLELKMKNEKKKRTEERNQYGLYAMCTRA